MPDRSTTPRPLRLTLSRLTLTLLLLLSGCAAAGRHADPAAEDFNDPFENANRSIFNFNQKVDRAVLAPVAKGYRAALPPKVREALRHFFENLRGPIILTNDLLQGNGDLAGKTAVRFVVNSTVGFAGFFDVAGRRLGIPYHYQDFGLTFAVWGVGEGPYLVVPILGPNNPRDLSGTVAEAFADPWDIMAGNAHYLWAPIARHALSGIDERSQYIDELANIERTSLDYYATIRSLYRQRRDALIHHKEENLPPNPSFGSAPTTAPSPAPAAKPEEAPVVALLVLGDAPAPAPSPPGPGTLTPPQPPPPTAKPRPGTASPSPRGSYLAVAKMFPPGAPTQATLTPPAPTPSPSR